MPHILIVDDDQATARLEKRHLTRAGFEVSIAPCAKAGLEFLAREAPDAMVLDHQLTGLTGIEFFREVTARGFRLPAVIVTGMEKPSLVEEAREAGISEFLLKTVDYLDRLPEVMQAAIDRYHVSA